MSVDLENQHI
jgi:hypothetical protein